MLRRWAIVLMAAAYCPAVDAQSVTELANHAAPVYAVAFRPDGKRLASASFDHTVKIWDASTGALLRTLARHSAKVLALAWSPDGKLLASADAAGSILLWEGGEQPGQSCKEAGTPVRVVEIPSCLHTLAFSPDGRRLFAGGEDHTIHVWDMDRVQSLADFACTACAIYALSVSADGRLVAAAGLDGIIHLYHSTTGRRLCDLEGHTDSVYGLAFAPNGQLASASGDCTVRLWDPKTGRQLIRLDGHLDPVYQVGFRQDGRRLLSAATNGQVVVWDATDGAALHSHHFPGRTFSATFAPDGRSLAAGAGSGACYLLQLPRSLR